MRAYYSHRFVLPLPPGHRFPMQKYARLHERLLEAAARAGIVLDEAPAASDADLLRAHDPDYVARVLAGTLSASEQRRIGFPWSPAMVARTRRVSGGTIAALASAIDACATAVNLAGGTHHAAHDRGAGYCVFNDSVVAIRHAQAHSRARRVLVIDLDVHQGDGTAEICADDASVFTFSMHAERNFPAVKRRSDLDVALPDGCADAQYLDLLAQHLPEAIVRAEADAAIYLAGADPFVGDRLGFLALSKQGLRMRDRMVFQHCERAGLPVAVTMGGGYAEDVEDIVDIHLATVLEAAASAAGRREGTQVRAG
jgi:acetoin utilization deacetylase AcuC-like enzyme